MSLVILVPQGKISAWLTSMQSSFRNYNSLVLKATKDFQFKSNYNQNQLKLSIRHWIFPFLRVVKFGLRTQGSQIQNTDTRRNTKTFKQFFTHRFYQSKNNPSGHLGSAHWGVIFSFSIRHSTLLEEILCWAMTSTEMFPL